MRLSTWLGALVACAGVSVAGAQEFDIVDEVRFGATISEIGLSELSAPVYVLPDLTTFDIANLDSVQFNVLFRSPDLGAFDWLGKLRPEIGGVVNLRGRESLVHAGLNWQLPLGDTFYLEAEGGLSIHNGALQGAEPPLHNLGCRVLFHWSYGVGANLDERWTVTANLQHVSNIIFGCYPNESLNHFGVSLGYKF
jgi:lipid A 3-O-deacylase